MAYIWKQTLLAERRAKKIDGQPVKQILLIHANLLNSLCLEDIIELYRKNGYKFISLSDALKGNTAQPIGGNAEAAKNADPAPKEIKSNQNCNRASTLNSLTSSPCV